MATIKLCKKVTFENDMFYVRGGNSGRSDFCENYEFTIEIFIHVSEYETILKLTTGQKECFKTSIWNDKQIICSFLTLRKILPSYSIL